MKKFFTKPKLIALRRIKPNKTDPELEEQENPCEISRLIADLKNEDPHIRAQSTEKLKRTKDPEDWKDWWQKNKDKYIKVEL